MLSRQLLSIALLIPSASNKRTQGERCHTREFSSRSSTSFPQLSLSRLLHWPIYAMRASYSSAKFSLGAPSQTHIKSRPHSLTTSFTNHVLIQPKLTRGSARLLCGESWVYFEIFPFSFCPFFFLSRHYRSMVCLFGGLREESGIGWRFRGVTCWAWGSGVGSTLLSPTSLCWDTRTFPAASILESTHSYIVFVLLLLWYVSLLSKMCSPWIDWCCAL